MSTETMINSMGGSIKENVKRGPKGPQRNPFKQALLQLALFVKSQPECCAYCRRTLGSSLSQEQATESIYLIECLFMACTLGSS